MKRLVRLITILSVICIIGSIVLLLNFTAPNPTGRRYSSEMPLTTGQASSQSIGISGETILGRDLRLPNNNDSGETQCICGNSSQPKAGICRACLAVLPALSTSYRKPDFVGNGFIAESKNEQDLLYSGREVSQINDYVLAAILMKAQLWVFVRVDTDVAPEFTRLVESTGGGIAYYFTVPGYADPTDSAANKFLLVSGVFLGLKVGWWWTGRWKMISKMLVWSPKSPRAPRQPRDPASRVLHKTEAAEDFAKRRKDRERQKIEIEDARDDE
jgi:hypothetical protein